MKKLAFSFLAVFVAITLFVTPALANSGPPWAGTSLDDLTINLGDPFTNLDTDVTVVSTANNFADGYLEVAVTGAAASDEFQLVSGGLLTVTGDAVLYNGTRIGTIDGTYNGSNGRLRVNFSASAPLNNSGFETGDLSAWTVDYTDNQVQAQSWAVEPTGFSSCSASGTKDPSPTVDDGSSITDAATVQSGNVHGGSYALQMTISGQVVYGCGSSHSPSIKSSVFTASAGDSLSLWYNALPGSDESDVYGFVINSTGGRQLLFHSTGNTGGFVNVSTAITSAVCASGNCSDLQFEFINGTFDATGGMAVGSNLYIDDIVLTLAAPPVVTDVMVEAVAENLQYRNTSATPTSPRPYSMNFKDNSTATGDNQANIYIIIPPTITTIVPNAGPTAGGTSVVITGTALTGGTVTFGGLPATCTVDSPTQMTCTSPVHAAGAVDVVVTTPDGSATSTGGFTYVAPPTIASIVPNSGPTAGGTNVVITGTNLTGGTVTFDGITATCTVDSATQITCTSPAHAAGPVDVVVTTVGGPATFVGGFTYIPAPTITTIVPNSGLTAGGTSVVITGTNLTGGTVTFGGSAASCTVDSPTQITCTTPAHAAGAVDVVVTTPGGSATSAGGFTYVAAPPTTLPPVSFDICPPGSHAYTSGDIVVPPASGTGYTDVDVAFVIDTTGSMGGQIDSAKAGAIDIMTGVKATFPGAQFAVIEYKDYPPQDALPFFIHQTLTTDNGLVSTAINGLSASGGGDFPESAGAAFIAAQGLSWRGGTVGKFIVLITDAEAQPVDVASGKSIDTILGELNTADITLLVVASGSQAYWETKAALTGDNAEVITYVEDTFDEDVINLIIGAASRNLSWTLSDPTYNSWVSSVPTSYGIGADGDTYTFDVTITVPVSATGTHTFTINYALDGTVTATEQVTINIACVAFAKTSPSNAATNVSLSPTLTWETSAGATSYEYCYSSAPGPCTKWYSVGSDTSVTLSGLAHNYTYYWQVRAVSPDGTTEADGGTWWSFTTTTTAACTWPAYTAPTTPTFGDVPMTVPHWSSVERLYNATITATCGNGNFCPHQNVNRAQIAIFLLRARHCGSSYVPPAVGSSTGFNDVPLTATYAPWVKQLAAEGITAGCGNGNFCPLENVNRAQMAIFLLRARHGSTYSPPAVGATTGFGDVPLSATYAPWVKQLAADGITAGCGGGNFCPLISVPRAQMAIFIVRAFGLP